MHTTLKAFLEGQHEDETDKLAQRALKAHGQLIGEQGFIANAYERGDGEAYTAVCRAHLEASAAFILANEVKGYPFAETVLAQMPELAIAGDAGTPTAAAAYLVGSAETAIAAYADRCAPVCRIIGHVGVRILRGAHAIAAMQGLVPANQA